MMGFGWTSSFLGASDAVLRQLLRSKALSTMYETPNCPIVSFLAYKALLLTQHITPRFIDDGYHSVPRDFRPISPPCVTLGTRLLFAQLFGISPENQIVVENWIMEGKLASIPDLVKPSSDSAHFASRYLLDLNLNSSVRSTPQSGKRMTRIPPALMRALGLIMHCTKTWFSYFVSSGRSCRNARWSLLGHQGPSSL